MSSFRTFKFAPAIFGIGLSFALTACSTAKPIAGPDGSEHELVEASTLKGCYAKARDVCRGPYKIVDSHSDPENFKSFSILVKCGS